MNMDILLADTLNQLFMRRSYTQIKFSKNNVASGKTPFFVIGRFRTFCILDSIFLSIGLFGSVVFSIIVFSTKKTLLHFAKKSFRFSEKLLQT